MEAEKSVSLPIIPMTWRAYASLQTEPIERGFLSMGYVPEALRGFPNLPAY